MKIKLLCFFLFMFFCDLVAKDMNFDLQGQIVDKSSIQFKYNTKNLSFTYEILLSDPLFENTCSVTFNSNVKSPLESVLSTPHCFIEDGLAFCNKDHVQKIKIYLYSVETDTSYGNNAVIYTKSDITEPISNIMNLGIKIPATDSSILHDGDLYFDFILTLKNIG